MYKQFYSILIVLLCVILGFSCSTKENQQNNEIPEPLVTIPKPVAVQIIESKDFSLEMISNGIIRCSQKAEMQFSQQGFIQYLPISNGSIVKKGDTLAVINNSKQYVNLQKAKMAVLDANNELSSLMLGFGGTVNDTNSVKKSILNNLKIQSGYSQALLNKEIALIDYQHTFLLAPFGGLIANLKVLNYQQTNGSVPLCCVIGKQDFIVEFNIIETELSKIKVGQSIKVFPLAYDSLYFIGKINAINPVVDKHGLTQINASIEESSLKSAFPLYEGMNARIIIEKKIPNSISIPKKALVLRNNKEVVFTYKAGKAYWNYVKTTAENSKLYLVSNGIKSGDTIIVQGNLNLAHDADIVIKN